MLYISTRNNTDTYTAHRALHKEFAPDGGFFVPFYLPTFSPEAINYFSKKPAYETMAEILNLFFSVRLCASDIEDALGKDALTCENLNQNVSVIELWHTAEGNSEYLFKKLNYLLSGDLQFPVGWARIAIEISLLFSMLSICKQKAFDIAVSASDLASITAISYAKAMGLPVQKTICACEDDCLLWEMINKGECSASNTPVYMELYLYKVLGGEIAADFVKSKENNLLFRIDEEHIPGLSEQYYPAVVSCERANSIITGIFRANQYIFDFDAAFSYGSLQDYRASTGINNQTVIFSNKKPDRIKE